jgi:hypothetical protein
MEQLKYPIGIQNFEKLRKEQFVYVDKTALVYKLASEGCYYTLTRPRRFGKSLLVSTLEAYFNGQRELFQGLAIEQLGEGVDGPPRAASRPELQNTTPPRVCNRYWMLTFLTGKPVTVAT